MPVVLVITKFDHIVSQVFLDSFSGAPRQHDRARDSAHAMYRELCRRLFDKEARDIPAEIVSGIYSFLPVHLEGLPDVLTIHSENKFRRSR